MPFTIEVCNLIKIFYPSRPLWKYFGNKAPLVALDRINLQVQPGETMAIMGPNGAGKTTLLKILATLILPNGGSAHVLGLDCARHAKRIKKGVGFLSGEDRSFYWRLTGRQNLEFFAGLFGLSKKKRRRKIEEFRELFDLSFLDQTVGSCSTGMKQRLALARCLLHDPDLILLDEPTKGLDQKSSERFLHYLKEELSKKQGKTVMLATHRPEEAKKVADRILFLERGRTTP